MFQEGGKSTQMIILIVLQYLLSFIHGRELKLFSSELLI